MKIWKSLLLLPLVFSPYVLKAQEIQSDVPLGDNVAFTRPEGYVDQEFRELAAQYIQPQIPGDLDELLKTDGKVTPEILQRLVDMISIRVSQQIREDLMGTLRENSRQARNISTKKSVEKTNMNIGSPNAGANNFVNNSWKRKKVFVDAVGNPSELSKPRYNGAIRSVAIQGTRGSKVNVNSASRRNINVNLFHSKNVTKARVSVVIRNTRNNREILVAQKMLKTSPSGKTDTNIRWSNPKVPMGNYKMFVNTEFYNSRNQIIARDTSYWGNSNTSEFIIIKN